MEDGGKTGDQGLALLRQLAERAVVAAGHDVAPLLWGSGRMTSGSDRPTSDRRGGEEERRRGGEGERMIGGEGGTEMRS